MSFAYRDRGRGESEKEPRAQDAEGVPLSEHEEARAMKPVRGWTTVCIGYRR